MSVITLGPVGGHGGGLFEDYTIPDGTHLTQLHLFVSNYINAIQITYTTADGEQVTLDRIGGQGGDQQTITLDSDEYITAIGGRCGWFIDSLYIGTNKRVSQTYGGSSGEYEFHYTAPKGNAIIGFFGRAAWYIDKIGAVAQPITSPEKLASQKKQTVKSQPKELQKVEGIGLKISTLLIDADIPNLATLAQTPVEKLQEILETAGSRYRIIDPTTWPEQAALGAADKWDDLKALQDTLKGGRRVS